jgi:tetratricopeptide (TPR) repeat protein
MQNAEVRIEIIKGNNEGSKFRVTGERVVFGRAVDTDIVITDASASRKHAELVLSPEGYVLKDLNSSNGIYVNGKRLKEKLLVSGDIFAIGDHQYKYIVAQSPEAEPKLKKSEIAGLGASNNLNSGSMKASSLDLPPIPGGQGGGSKKRLIIYGVLGALLLFALVNSQNKNEPVKPAIDNASNNETTELTFYDKIAMQEVNYQTKVPEGMEDNYNKANDYYFSGRREFRVNNYVRALEEFKKALAFYPNHGQSRYYIKLTTNLIKQESVKNLNLGKKMMSLFKYNEAIRRFEEVINLNSRDPNSNIYKEAEKYRDIALKKDKSLFK